MAPLHEPFLLSPAGKDYLWGGERLRDDFDKQLQLQPLAETWECSTMLHTSGRRKPRGFRAFYGKAAFCYSKRVSGIYRNASREY